MKKTTLAVILLANSLMLTAQQFSLDWKGYETIDYGTEKKNYPKFSNEGYSVENATVYYNIKGISNGSLLKIQNQQWKKISTNELLDLKDDIIPEADASGISYDTDSQSGKEYFYAKIAVFRREKNEIYQLQSFELVKDNQPKAFLKSTAIVAGSDDNPLKSGNIYKIKVDKSGIFKVDKKFLSNIGINTNNINPKNLKIYGNGGIMLPEDNRDLRYSAPQEIAIQVVGEEDSVWNDGDYALFYAQGADGYNVYQNRRDNRTDSPKHLKNIYEDFAYYFITFDNGEGKRISDSQIPITGDTFTRYNDYQYINNDKHNILKLGRLWVDDHFSSEKNISFPLRSSLPIGEEITIRASVIGYNNTGNHYKISVNGTNEEKSGDFSGTLSRRTTNITDDNLSGNALNIKITPVSTANPNGLFYLDYVEVQYKEDLKFNGSQMNFRSYDITENFGENYGFSISDIAHLEQVWDVSDTLNPLRKINQSGNNSSFSFGYNADRKVSNEFVAFRNDAAYTPTFVSKIENQDLHALENIDYLIITQRDMMNEGERIAKYHQTKNGFSTKVVDVAQIYNEFSSGSQDITAIRDFITRLNNQRGGLKYVLLIGDTSYDFKNRISGNDNIIPSYQSEESGSYSTSYVTDDYFVMTKSQTNSFITGNLPDIPIGRLPASNVTEAKLMVDKTLAYYNALPNQSSPFGDWRMKLDFVVDDDADTGTPFHITMDNALKDNFENGQRSEYNIKKLYLDAFPPETASGGQRYPKINQAVNNAFGNSLFLMYFGHGGINGWAQERVLTFEDIRGFHNYSRLHSRFPLVSTITCEFTLWDEPNTFSAGEQVMKHTSGGAATMITSSRAIGVTYGEQMTQKFTSNIFKLTNNTFDTLGNAFLATKKEQGFNSNHLRVNYLGDPAMSLSRPKPLLSIDTIETPENGKIRALDKVKITGKVQTENGTTDTNFNGKIYLNIYDKRINKETRNNDGGLGKMSFSEENSPIVKTSAKVINGLYTTEFYVPKDINYELGQGRILAYAENFETAKENAHDVFHNMPYTIGEINPNPEKDNAPPAVKLYMNNPHFADGGITNANPTLLACITDDMGINSSGAGIGHDITLVLDGEVVNTMVLNDFYSAGEGNGCISTSLADYQKGSVAYPLRNLKAGQHQITFKVWDINNNSSTASLNFIVKDETEDKLTLNRLLNWPNPFTNKTYIHFEHNCDDILEVNVQIYTITGRLVKTISTTVSNEPFREGYRTPRTAIEWDGKDDFGDAVGKGTYIYKVFAKSKNQDRCKGSAQAIEKMVILK